MRRALEVFEHGSLSLGVGPGDLRQSELDALVRFNDDHDGRYFEVGHRKLTARSYVGYVEVGSLAIEILPKADRGLATSDSVWREGLLEMLRVALGLRLQPLASAAQKLTRSRLLDLIAQAFLAELAPLLREGLAKGYRTTQSNGAVFRGRLQIATHLRDNLARADRFFVEYQTFDHDIAVNRVLAAALEALSWCALSPSVADKIDACLAQLPEVQAARVTAADVDELRLTRATQRYAGALRYARMILAQQGPHLRHGRERVFSLLFDMNVLWERYVAVLLRRAAPPGVHVHAQERHAFWTSQDRGVRRVRPDFVVRAATRDGRRAPLLVIDTKWKVPSTGIPSDDDLQQMFVYNELLASPRSILLYPQTVSSQPASGVYATRLHTCEQRQIGLSAAGRWSSPAIQRQLADLLSEACQTIS